ncbi:MAG: tRNA (guanosine(46)-N7)-methyltransferase TrmB [Buchnera aphidicola (Periphyllus acericola)]|uniref:tRNA (guanosine(46)-N7)-methyltransferase TrmB n=1 Tax=Buchnera aphidicola TaxID=9 RepID=UPI0030D5C0BB|nr:tRNA (guanosine(46)-N7)-methyltransferase TrmB [Buchnera aphidicola (Periphyllus acericola)]
MINKSIKTFRLRNRKLTQGKIDILNLYWPIFGLDIKKKINFESYFLKKSSLILEIGFGYGESLINFASQNRNIRFIGIEVYIPGICFCLNKIHLFNLNNINIFYGDAINFLENHVQDILFNRINIFFPDPWNKRKHFKRRLIQKNFIKKISKNLIFNGFFHILTDSYSYFKYILMIFNQINGFKNKSKKMNFYFFHENKFYTRFLDKAQSKKKYIYSIFFKKKF